ncbi:uncharacterized protein M6B38_411740 [Iris pallida]|uniref:BZIP domain-containing protein n=1 Tax=Iris pallida TaxID=29817 RepID=A0AAX6FM93_IRIPA|nr:uncharacterized protein M6B38_411740 [Iris pallida]
MGKAAAMQNPKPNLNPRPMGEMELDAARALAEMAKIEKLENGGGRSSKKRINDGGSPDLQLDIVSSKSKHACLVDDDPQDSEVSAAVEEEIIKVEQNSEFSTSNISCPSSQMSFFARRTKQNTTEGEKEARRIRRVLANRESARQTIRRRQALREELTKKVVDLSFDNENMKMEKELIMKEYFSLKDRNKELKEQMAKTIKRKVEVEVETTSSQLETSTSPSTELSLVTSSRPAFTPYVKSSRPVVSPETIGRYGEGNPCKASTMTNLYPHAWFYPLLRHTSQNDRPSSHSHNDQDVDSITQHCQVPCSQEVENGKGASIHEGRKPDFPLTVKTCIKERTITGINLEELPVECDGQNDMVERDLDTATCLPAHGVPNPSSASEGELIADVKVQEIEMLDIPVPEKAQVMYIKSHKTSIDLAAAAAEARKKRKELKKLKFLHTRQIRLHS